MLGKSIEALRLYETAFRKQLGDKHPETKETAHDMAKLYLSQGVLESSTRERFDVALDHYGGTPGETNERMKTKESICLNECDTPVSYARSRFCLIKMKHVMCPEHLIKHLRLIQSAIKD